MAIAKDSQHWRDMVDKKVVNEQGLVKSRNPDDIPAFNREMLSVFAESGVER